MYTSHIRMKTHQKIAAAALACLWAVGPLTSCGGGQEEVAAPLRLKGLTERGLFGVGVEVEGGEIPLNVPFELWVDLKSGSNSTQPLPGRTLLVEGWMPGHGHGMLRQSEVDDLGDGRYRVRGMLFHMPGTWELRIKVIETRLEEEFRVVEDDQVSFEVKL